MPNEPALWRARTYPYRLDSGSKGLWPAPQYFTQRLMDRWRRLSVDRGFEASANPRGELEHDRPRRGFEPPSNSAMIGDGSGRCFRVRFMILGQAAVAWQAIRSRKSRQRLLSMVSKALAPTFDQRHPA